MRRLVAAAVVLAVLAAGAASAAAQGEWPDGKPEIDFVVVSRLKTSPAHQEALLRKMYEEVTRCFPGLAEAVVDLGQRPAAGAAWHRLAVAYAATITADGPTATRARFDDVIRNPQAVVKHTGTLQFDLARWTGKRYQSVDRWSVRIADRTLYSGRRSVHLEDRAAVAAFRQEAIESILPPDVDQMVYQRLLPMKLGKGEDGRPSMAVANRFPWPMKRLRLRYRWYDVMKGMTKSYKAVASHTGLLMAGDTVVLPAEVEDLGIQKLGKPAQPATLSPYIEFETARGPTWIGRRTDEMTGDDEKAKAQALAAVQQLAGSLTPEEAKAAVPALLEKMRITEPTGEADLPKDLCGVVLAFGPSAVPHVVPALRSLVAGQRLAAVCLLRDLKANTEEARKRLQAAAKGDKSDVVRAAAVEALKILDALPSEKKIEPAPKAGEPATR